MNSRKKGNTSLKTGATNMGKEEEGRTGQIRPAKKVTPAGKKTDYFVVG